MKIITKVKEYYDYLQGIYGIDELVVYDRRTKHLIIPFEPESKLFRVAIGGYNSNSFEVITFAICNKIYKVYMYNDTPYHTPQELLELNQLIKSEKGYLWKDRILYIDKGSWDRKPVETLEDATKYYYDNNGREVQVNKVLRQPILIKYNNGEFNYISSEFDHHGRSTDSQWGIPYLTKYNFASWYSAEEIWKDIYSFICWLKDNPEIPNKQNDLEKLQAHGFDKKVSFRHRKN